MIELYSRCTPVSWQMVIHIVNIKTDVYKRPRMVAWTRWTYAVVNNNDSTKCMSRQKFYDKSVSKYHPHIIKKDTVPFRSIRQAMLRITCLPKFWFRHMGEMTVTQIFFGRYQQAKGQVKVAVVMERGRRRSLTRHYNEDMADMCVDCSILGNLSISQAWAGSHFNLLTQRVLHNS